MYDVEARIGLKITARPATQLRTRTNILKIDKSMNDTAYARYSEQFVRIRFSRSAERPSALDSTCFLEISFVT